jgi:SMC interacting uncharacterized protein involved in chromosome segregation
MTDTLMDHAAVMLSQANQKIGKLEFKIDTVKKDLTALKELLHKKDLHFFEGFIEGMINDLNR